MKKLFLLAMILLGGVPLSKTFADEPINVPMHFINESGISKGKTKSPIRPLVITQDGNTLTLPATGVDYMLQLFDEDGTLVYTAFVPRGTTQVVLPSTLSGLYEIRLVADTYYYIGYLNL